LRGFLAGRPTGQARPEAFPEEEIRHSFKSSYQEMI
jgi:hypothetical protein